MRSARRLLPSTMPNCAPGNLKLVPGLAIRFSHAVNRSAPAPQVRPWATATVRIGTNAARRLVIEGGELDAAQGQQSGLVSVIAADGAEPPLPLPRVSRESARAVRVVTRADHRDADLAALVRSASVPGLQARITAYRERLLLPRGAAG